MTHTPSQQQAIAARGNVLVVAGAGTGKTRTLVERCLDCLLNEKPRVSIDEILMVTFTDAAAAEMRRRIRERIEAHAQENPADLHWAEQLALFETAHIGTLHSFCFQLVRQHFYSLKLDPQVAVLSAEESALHARDALDEVMQRHYTGKTGDAEAVQKLIQIQGRGSDFFIRKLVVQLHHHTQTLPDPQRWFEEQLAMFATSKPLQWESWLVEGVRDWRKNWLQELQNPKKDNAKAAACAAALEKLPETPSRADCAAALAQIREIGPNFPNNKKSPDTKRLEKFFSEAAFFDSLANLTNVSDPLVEDWNWVREQMTALLRLAREFGAEFTRVKRELGALDFHDLEQCALELLWDNRADQPTKLARQWRERLRHVFVDEYQDINSAQDKILAALSRDGVDANRFLVGDVKQSIYRFRLANPSIFRRYKTDWCGVNGKTIPLADNFRSHENILAFVNSLFGALMRPEIGGVDYDAEAELRFGETNERKLLSCAADKSPRVELHLKIKGGSDANESTSNDETSSGVDTLAELAATEAEAHLVASRLRELKNERHLVWDDNEKKLRPVNWCDMAILLRAPAGKAEAYAKEFQRVGVPLIVARSGFYESMEVLDLLNLLQLLDNPLQDLPALAVLRSPFIGLTADELARVRLVLPHGHFWNAVQEFHRAEKNPKTNTTWRKIDLFLVQYRKWRRLARQGSLSRCLEAVLGETFYESWLLTQPRGQQRQTNVRRFLGLAQQFDEFQRQGLFRFLRFIEAQQLAEAEPDFPTTIGEDAVRLMSIHQSKGLEFPVVVVADLGKAFNVSDLQKEIILDEKFGLCPQIRPPHTGRNYPSLPFWLARQRQKKELLGEELRLLYVATTRAKDTLILMAAVTEKKLQHWSNGGEIAISSLLAARSGLDLLGLWFGKACTPIELSARAGENKFLRWFLHTEADARHAGETKKDLLHAASLLETDEWQKVQQRLAWQYAHCAATDEPAKTSVSALRERYAEEQDLAAPFNRTFQKNSFKTQPNDKSSSGFSTTDRGTAHHTFLQLISLERAGSIKELKAEAVRLERAGALQPAQVQVLDFAALAAFWQSDLGQRIRANAPRVRRELAFTSRFLPGDLAKLVGTKIEATLDKEFVVVQGVVDLAVILPTEIWIVDFKTDQFAPAQLSDKIALYEPQLLLYAVALNRIYRKPVSEVWLHFLSLQKSEQLAT